MSSDAVIMPVLTRNGSAEAEDRQATRQPANMTNQQEDKQNVDQPKLVLNLNLNYSTRNRLINSLNELSIIFQCDEPIPEDAKQRTCRKIDDSMRLLVYLLPFGSSQSIDDTGVFEERISGQLTVKLPRAERSRIVSHLIDIKDAVLYDDKISRAAKESLVTENRRIVDQLLSLPCKVESNAIAKRELAEKIEDENSDEPQLKKQKIEPEESGLHEELVHVEARMRELQNELTAIARASVSFKFELVDVSKFFENDFGKYQSDRFWCRGLQWSVYVKPHLKDDHSKYLDLFLHCHNDEPQSWSCRVDCELFLYSNLSDGQNYVLKFAHNFNKDTGFGYKYFISYRKLTDEKGAGYIKDDKIVLGVELKAEPVVREDESQCSGIV